VATPVRYPSGVTNVKPADACANLPMPSRTRLQYVFDDCYNLYAHGLDYAGTTSAALSIAPADGAGGVIRMNVTAVTDSYCTLTQIKEAWTVESGKRMWIGARIKPSKITDLTWGFGLGTLGTDYVGTTPAEGVFFRKDDLAAGVDIKINTGGATSTSATDIKTTVAATWVTYEIEFDGVSAFKYFIDGVHVGTLTTTAFPTTELTLFLYCESGVSSTAFTLDIDWFYAAKERMTTND